MIFSSIPFASLSGMSDSTTIVMTGLLLTEAELPDVNKFFHQIGLIPAAKNLTGAYLITGNVNGSDGRTDWMFEFDRPDLMFNVMVRLQFGRDLKWTSDFVDNFACDYAAA